MILPNAGVAVALDRIAEMIRSASDYYSREAAIAEFRAVCRNNPEPLDPAMEAVNRDIVLVNPLHASQFSIVGNRRTPPAL